MAKERQGPILAFLEKQVNFCCIWGLGVGADSGIVVDARVFYYRLIEIMPGACVTALQLHLIKE